MKAIQYRSYGTPDVLEYVEIAEPVPGPGEALIAVEAVSVGPGDCKTRAGELHAFHPVTFPKTPGRSGVGTIRALGEPGDATARHGPGTRVYFSTTHAEPGCCAQYVVRPLADLTTIDTRLDVLAAAALVHPALCAWIALNETVQVRAGMRVLIHGGAGAIGAQAIQLARHLGAQVSVTAAARDLAYVCSLGAHQALAYDNADAIGVNANGTGHSGAVTDAPADAAGAAPAAGDFTRFGAPFDVVFDLVGGATQQRSFAVLKPDGLLVYLIAEPVTGLAPGLEARRRLARIAYTPATVSAVLALAVQGVLKPQQGRVLPLSDCAQAHRLIESRQQGRGRLLLSVR